MWIVYAQREGENWYAAGVFDQEASARLFAGDTVERGCSIRIECAPFNPSLRKPDNGPSAVTFTAGGAWPSL